MQPFASERKINTSLYYSQRENEYDNDEIEAIKNRLELFIQKQNRESGKPLSMASRMDLITEMNLIESLKTSDVAISLLRAIWLSGSGKDAGEDLIEAERLAAMGPSHYISAEEKFLNVINENGSWPEPLYRLASLLYKQERLEESRKLLECVLSAKPWHFGALSDIVAVCNGMDDTVNANIWAERYVPPLKNTQGRKQWVDRVLYDIQKILSVEDSSDTDTIAGLDPDMFDDVWQ